jgi:hypothetical protein
VEQTVEEQVFLAAENSGLDFSSLPTKVTGGEVIKILNDKEGEAINKYVQGKNDESRTRLRRGNAAGCG